jgi:hypothetical protein
VQFDYLLYIEEAGMMTQLRVRHDVISSPISDFQIGNRTFEVGGRNKGKKQIQDVENGYVVKDDIETGFRNVIPLWQLGLIY